MTQNAQGSLFDTDDLPQASEVAAARKRMRDTIDALREMAVPPWTKEIEVILRDGEFKRAMWLVSAEEGAAWWAEYDVEMERLYAVWAATPEG